MTKLLWWPHTRLGKWSGVFLIAFVLLVFASVAWDSAFGGPDDPWLRVIKWGILVALLATGLTATWAVVRMGERSVTTYAALAVTVLVLLFELIAE